MNQTEKEITEYISKDKYRKKMGLPAEVTEEYRLLAQGEYNRNYLFKHPSDGRELVLRINCGSQMHLNHQIEYEANALKLLEKSGRTAHVYYVDGLFDAPGEGVLVMDYLPGRNLDYKSAGDLKGAAECLADIHSVIISEKDIVPAASDALPADADRLIAPDGTMKAILSECEDMLSVYMCSDLPADDKKRRLRKLLDDAWKLASDEQASPYRCCINAELNSTNFLVEESDDFPLKVRLVDWEKPLYGDPAQDLAHFLAPTTTFWKTDVVFGTDKTENFIDMYIDAVNGRFDTEGLRERTLAMIPVTCLRGMTWCAMAWIQYRNSDKELVNQSTADKLEQYLCDEFISDIEIRVKSALTGGECR